MSERYTFTSDRSLISLDTSNNGGVVEWNSFNTTLTTSMNDGYVTVNDDQTQYLSALDDTTANEINLDSLNLTLTPNPKMEIGCNNNNDDLLQQRDDTIANNLEQEQNNDIGENQVVVYTVEGSDELYGIQLVQDEDGNIQKYQFQFRKTDDGQLEAIPETIQILPLDEDEISADNENLINLNDDIVNEQQQEKQSLQQEEEQEQRSLQIYVHNDNPEEHILPDLPTDDYNQMLFTENDTQKEPEDIKSVTIEQVNIKEEVNDFIKYNDNFDINPTTTTDEGILEETSQTSMEEAQLEQHDEEEEQEEEFNVGLETETIYTQVLQSQEKSPINKNKNNNDDNTHNFNDDTIVKQIILPEIDNDVINIRNEQQNESDNDEYQVVEGLHITGDFDDNSQQQQQQQYEYQQKFNTTISKTNILKHNIKHPERLEIKKDNRYFLYFIHHEKENVDSGGHYNNTEIYQKNPRSILKQCYLSSPQKNEQFSTTITNLSPPTTITTTTTTTTTQITTTSTPIIEQDERMSKRFARNKEAIQAMNLINFINTTTIPIAPIRKDRLPRKQKIKPVERQDEQIVVQEVMISSNSFIESSEQIDLIKRDTIEITDYVELTDSDSDSDYNPNNHKNHNSKKSKLKKKKKNKRYKLRNQITISDSDTDNTGDDDDDDGGDGDKNTVIELDDDDDEDININNKREFDNNSDGNADKNSESPLKKLCLDTNDLKKEIPCPKCSKSFPSQNSLKTHLQHHNLENTLNNDKNKTNPQTSHKCDKCNELFKNRILLSQHKCPTIFTCTICKKKFTDIIELSKHKRTHMKQQLFKTTSTIRISPKKFKSPQLQRSSSTINDRKELVKSPQKFKSPSRKCYKCKQCGKLCSSLSILNLHNRTHKDYSCNSCKLNFPSKILLDNHVQKDCVKLTKTTTNRRTLRNSTNLKTTNTTATTSTITTISPNRKKTTLTLICDECSLKFTNSKLLIKHKIEKHNLQTPNKNLLLSSIEKEQTKRHLYRPKPRHCGIPAKQSLRNIFADMQTQLNQESKQDG